MTNTMQTDDNFSIGGISWTEIQAVLSKDPYKQASAKMTKSVCNLVLDKENEDKLIDAVLKTLEKTDPENAIYKHAVITARQVQDFARKRLEEIEAES